MDDQNMSARSMQQQVVGWLQARDYSMYQIASVMGCSSVRASRICNLKIGMTMDEFARVLHHAGLGWPRLADLPVVRSVAERPKVWARTPKVDNSREGLDARKRARREAVKPVYDQFQLTVSNLRARIMEQRPLPVVEDIDPQHPLEDIVMGRLHRQRAALVERAGSSEALASYAAQLSQAIAAAMLRQWTGAQQLNLDAYYMANPDALRTPYDLIVALGGDYSPVHAAELHARAIAASVAD